MGTPQFLAAARLRAAEDWPYFSTALFALTPVESSEIAAQNGGMPTIGVDKHWRLYYAPEAAGFEVKHLAAMLVHEVGHLLRAHHERCDALREPHNAAGWNYYAADPEINDDLIAQGGTFPFPVCTPDALGFPDNLTAEEYYALAKQKHGRAPGRPQGGVGNGACGSCAHGQQEPHEQGAPGESHAGPDGTRIENAPGVSAAEAELIAKDVARAIESHAKGRGTVPAGWVRWAESKLQPKRIDWRRELAATLRGGLAAIAGRVDYTYRKPSRRNGVVPDVILPSLRQPLPRLALVADTSGSVSDEQLGLALGVIRQVLTAAGVGEGLPVISCDAAAHGVQRIFSKSRIELAGGGGTDMGAGIARALALKPRPSLIIVVTDGLTPWPAEPPPGARVVIAMLADDARGGHLYKKHYPPPRWAKVVDVEVAA